MTVLLCKTGIVVTLWKLLSIQAT